MKAITVTGSFGSGKTTVAKMFGVFGLPLVSADEIVAALYKKKQVKKLLAKNFGKQIFSKKGKLKRKALAQIVFLDKALLQKLNLLIHPLVLGEVEKKLHALYLRKKKFAVVEVPLLFESKSRFPFDFVVAVKCKRKKQLARLFKKGISKNDALARIRAQLSVSKKTAKADFVVDNSGTLAATRKQVKKIFGQIVGG